MDHATVGKGPRCVRVHNIFHTLHTKLGIKDFNKHLVLEYRGCLHKYIQDEMEFLDISLLGMAYQYDVKIKHKFK